MECERNVCQSELERIRMELANLFPRSNTSEKNFSQSYQNECNDQPSMLYKILEEKLQHCQTHSIQPNVNDYEKSRL